MAKSLMEEYHYFQLYDPDESELDEDLDLDVKTLLRSDLIRENRNYNKYPCWRLWLVFTVVTR